MVKTAFFPVFFGRVFPEYKPEFAFLNAICISGVGLISCLFGGALADKYNRKVMLSSIIILASLTQVLTGVVDSFTVLCGMRVLHGCFNSATNPLAYSLVSDIIPPN
jgi:MFS family permease